MSTLFYSSFVAVVEVSGLKIGWQPQLCSLQCTFFIGGNYLFMTCRVWESQFLPARGWRYDVMKTQTDTQLRCWTSKLWQKGELKFIDWCLWYPLTGTISPHRYITSWLDFKISFYNDRPLNCYDMVYKLYTLLTWILIGDMRRKLQLSSPSPNPFVPNPEFRGLGLTIKSYGPPPHPTL